MYKSHFKILLSTLFGYIFRSGIAGSCGNSNFNFSDDQPYWFPRHLKYLTLGNLAFDIFWFVPRLPRSLAGGRHFTQTRREAPFPVFTAWGCTGGSGGCAGRRQCLISCTCLFRTPPLPLAFCSEPCHVRGQTTQGPFLFEV